MQNIQVCLRWKDGGALALTYSVEGRIARLRVPSPTVQRKSHQLWRHTCFEAFVAVKNQPAYHEFNFSPSGEWAAYAFSGYRDGAPLEREDLNPRIAVNRAPDKLILDAILRLDRLSPAEPRAPLTLALSAIIEDDNGGLSYWALKHAPGKPDFHHPEAFALEIERREETASFDRGF